jgi:hypothetical protein
MVRSFAAIDISMTFHLSFGRLLNQLKNEPGYQYPELSLAAGILSKLTVLPKILADRKAGTKASWH